jgi:hypothetical protein
VELSERYVWEAELGDGRVVTEGGELSDVVRFSFVPRVPGLPRHDLIGQGVRRRFGRGFVRGLGGGLREYVQCVVCGDFRFWVRCSDGTALVTPPDYELYL